MDQVPTSFIPKQALITRPQPRTTFGGIFVLIGFVALLSSVLLLGGAYMYRETVKGQIASMDSDLQRQQKAFEPKTLQDLVRLDARLNSASDLLGQHVTLLPLFDFINTETLKSVRFKTFSYAFNGATQKIDIKATGEADNYRSVALQSDIFAGGGRFREFFFSDLNLDYAGRVVFNFSASVDPTLISYNEALRSATEAISQPIQ